MTRLATIATIALVGTANAFTVPQNSLVSSRAPPLFVGREIEPKMEIENKSNEEKTGGDLAVVGGLAVFAKRLMQVMSFLCDLIYISDEDINIICGKASMSKGFIGEEKDK